MAKFMVLYSAMTTAVDQMSQASPEQMQASMDEWIQWKNEVSSTTQVEFGMPLQAVATISSEGMAESTSHVSGYSIAEAVSKDVVVEALRSHPHLKRQDASIDVFAMLAMPGM